MSTALGTELEWLENTRDPEDPDAKMYLTLSFDDATTEGGRERAWSRHLEYLSDKVIGDPRPTKWYTVERLKAMGTVGVYRRRGK